MTALEKIEIISYLFVYANNVFTPVLVGADDRRKDNAIVFGLSTGVT